MKKSRTTKPAITAVVKDGRYPVWLLGGLLVLATIVVYWPATSHGFINYDDPEYVTTNVHVQTGLTWQNIQWAFSHTVVGNWHPLTMLSHMLDCQLYGLKPWGHHLTNILLHTANTVLVFLLLRLMTGAVWRSWMVAVLFGLHPLHVESVAWVAERKDVLSTIFGLFSLMAYARYAQEFKDQSPKSKVRNRASGYYWLALVFLALGLMSKPMLVTLPFVMLLLDCWPLNRMQNTECGVQNLNRLLIEKIPFFALTAITCVVTYVMQGDTGMMLSLASVPLDMRLENAMISYCRYLGKLFWPTQLAVFYPYPDYWPMGWVLLAVGAMAGISVLVFLSRARHPYLLMGWLWFCGTLVPVIGLVQVGGQAMADRYAYIPSLGVLMAVVWWACDLAQGWRYHQVALGGTGCAAIILCIGLTRQQLGYWQDNETLYRHALAVTQNNYLAYHNLGIAFFKQGQFDKAISQYQKALRLQPDNAMFRYDLGTALGAEGRIDQAIVELQKAVLLNPDYVEAHANLGTALASEGQMDKAIEQYRQAIRSEPDNAEFHYDLGTALGRSGHIDDAIVQFQEALRLQPDFAAARHNLAHALQLQNSAADH